MRNNLHKRQKVYNESVMETIGSIHEARVSKGELGITCKTCTECHCCKANKQLFVSKEEQKILSSLITDEHRAKAKIAKVQKDLYGHYECPFLKDGRCSVYEVRPLVCSAYSVVDVDSDVCKDPKGSVYYLNSGGILNHALPKKDLHNYVKNMALLEDLLCIF